MNYYWRHDYTNRRQHWLHIGEVGSERIAGLVYEVKPDAYSVYGEDFGKNPFARVFLGVFPTLDEAKDVLVTITASQNF
jgi:hypothetical protein